MLDANADNIHSAIANFNTFTDVLAKNSDRIDGLIAGLERMTGGGAEPAKVPLYDLTAVKDFPPLTEQPSWQLVIPEPSALLALNTDKMTVKPEGAAESTDIPNAKWTDAAPILLQEKILQSFENAGYSRAVSRPKDGFEAGFQLLLDIRSFSLIDGDKPVGEVAFEAKVLGPDGKIVAAKTFKGTAPARRYRCRGGRCGLECRLRSDREGARAVDRRGGERRPAAAACAVRRTSAGRALAAAHLSRSDPMPPRVHRTRDGWFGPDLAQGFGAFDEPVTWA